MALVHPRTTFRDCPRPIAVGSRTAHKPRIKAGVVAIMRGRVAREVAADRAVEVVAADLAAVAVQ